MHRHVHKFSILCEEFLVLNYDIIEQIHIHHLS